MLRMPSAVLFVPRIAPFSDEVVVSQTHPAELRLAHLASHMIAALILLNPPSAWLPNLAWASLASLFNLLLARLFFLLLP